jgi:hypothetical protein
MTERGERRRVSFMRSEDRRMTVPRFLATSTAGIGVCALVLLWWPFTIVVVVGATVWVIGEIHWLRRAERKLLEDLMRVAEHERVRRP